MLSTAETARAYFDKLFLPIWAPSLAVRIGLLLIVAVLRRRGEYGVVSYMSVFVLEVPASSKVGAFVFICSSRGVLERGKRNHRFAKKKRPVISDTCSQDVGAPVEAVAIPRLRCPEWDEVRLAYRLRR